MYPYNYKMGQKIQTNVPGIAADRGFIAHLHWTAEEAVEADEDGVKVTNLLAAAQTITTGFGALPCARNVQIDGNVSGITGNVVITGINMAGEEITETLAANGTTAKEGNKAFSAVTKAVFPAQVHTPAAQVETATAAGTVTTAGNALVTVTSALLAEAEAIDVPVALNDDAAAIALAIRTALAANAHIAAHFVVSGADAAVILTAKLPAANDSTLNIAIDDGTGDGASEGVTTAATSTNTTPGVPYDQISIGWGDKLGLPYKLAHNTVLYAQTSLNNAIESTEPAVTVSATAIESNTIDLSSALDGHVVNTYLIV